MRSSYTNQGTQSALSDWLGRVQGVVNEPSTSGINSALSTFFNSFQDLQNNPEDNGVRTSVISAGQALAGVFKSVQTNLDVTNQEISAAIPQDMSTINNYGQQIAQLNLQIRQASAQNVQPNALMDQRDLLIDNLSKIVNINTSTNTDGTVNVAINSSDLVVGTSSSTVTLAGLQARGDLQGGDLTGLQQSQALLAGYQSQIDTLASTVATQVNAIHANGMGLDGTTGQAFFTGTDARTLAVNQTLVTHPNEIAAAAKVAPPATIPPPGDSSNAVLIAQIANTNMAALGNNTLQGYYGVTISNLGGNGNAAKTDLAAAGAATTQLTNQRSSISGVNTDQELTNMMKYQRSYQAASKFVSTQDGMLDTLINQMLSGR